MQMYYVGRRFATGYLRLEHVASAFSACSLSPESNVAELELPLCPATNMNPLPRIRPGLLRHLLDGQMLVYDSRDERVHLLDPTTGCVLELLEEGGWTSEGITVELARRFDVAPNPGFLQLALEELRKADLIDASVAPPEPMVDVTRREIVRKLAMTGVATLLVPTVATLTATRLYAQGSAQFGAGSSCSTASQCISGVCCQGICSNTGCPQADGAACNSNIQCESGACCNGICRDLTTDDANCGACGNVCRTDTEICVNTCVSGQCTPILC